MSVIPEVACYNHQTSKLGDFKLIIATRVDTTLRQALEEDLPRILEITYICYEPIQESFVSIVGDELYESVIRQPTGLTWQQRKEKQIRSLFTSQTEWIWILDNGTEIIGYVSFALVPDRKLGEIDNNGVHPDYAGKGWATFMNRQVLNYFRENGIRFAFIETELDDAHIPARRAYEAVGFDRPQKLVHYWQDLEKLNPGSSPE